MGLFPLLTGWPALAIAAACILAWTVTGWLKRPKAPGPLLARFSNAWYAHRMIKGHFEQDNVQLHRKYGKIVRIGPNLYSIDDDAAAKVIYGHGTQFTKGEWYKAWQIPKSELPVNLFAIQDIKHHASVRRQYANLYAMSSLVSYEPYVDNCVDILCRELLACSKQGQNINLAQWFQWYAFDVIGEITFSRRFGFMESRRDIDNMMQTIENVLEICSPIGVFPLLVLLQEFVASLGGGKSQNKIIQFATDRIREVKQALLHGHDEPDPEERRSAAPDFCSKAIAMAQSEKAARTDIDPDLLARGACGQNVFAGSDTTAISLNATVHNIITHPDVLAKIRAEMDEAVARGALSDPPTFAETQALPYLQAALKEALRMHPATGLPLWRQVPAGGVTLCGQYFPAGTEVGVNSWVAHRNQDVWGVDADDYRPERWLDSPEDKLRQMNALFMPFGLGSRTCIGKNISLLEISKVVPQLLRKFDISAVNRTGAANGGGQLPSRCAWFVKQKEFMAQIKPRQV